MTCYAYVMTWVGLLLMQLLGWVSIHDTHHHMGFLRKNFVVGIFGVWISGLLQLVPWVQAGRVFLGYLAGGIDSRINAPS